MSAGRPSGDHELPDLAEIHADLLAIHQEWLAQPTVEGLDGASCPPHLKHLAQQALSAAAAGFTAQRWRAGVLDGLGDEVAPLLQRAQACMREAGLWPWHDQAGGPTAHD